MGTFEQSERFTRSRDGTTIAYAVSGSGPPLVKAAHWLIDASTRGRRRYRG